MKASVALALLAVLGCDPDVPHRARPIEVEVFPPPLTVLETCEAICDARDETRRIETELPALRAQADALQASVDALRAEAKRRHIDVSGIDRELARRRAGL